MTVFHKASETWEFRPGPLFANERVKDGRIAVPNGPGLGVEVDEAVLREYAHRLHPDLLSSFPIYGTPRI